MSCALTQGYTLDCSDSYGGVKELHFIEFDNVVSITESAGVVTAITKATGKAFKKYQLIHQTADTEETATVSRENGTVEIKQSVKFPINKLSVSLRNELMLLIQNRLVCVAVDNNGTGWILGREFGLNVATVGAKSGIKLGERNGYEIALDGSEKVLAWKVDSSTISALQAVGS